MGTVDPGVEITKLVVTPSGLRVDTNVQRMQVQRGKLRPAVDYEEVQRVANYTTDRDGNTWIGTTYDGLLKPQKARL